MHFFHLALDKRPSFNRRIPPFSCILQISVVFLYSISFSKFVTKDVFMNKADLMLHPVRMRIILALNDRTLTPKQLAAELKDVAPATLYHHLNLLTGAGITQVVEERLVRGTLHEKVYTLSDASPLLSPDEVAAASKDELQQGFLAFVSKLIGDHA